MLAGAVLQLCTREYFGFFLPLKMSRAERSFDGKVALITGKVTPESYYPYFVDMMFEH